MINLRVSKSLQNIGREREREDYKIRDSSHSLTRIQGKVHNWVSQVGVCINKISHIKVETNQ